MYRHPIRSFLFTLLAMVLSVVIYFIVLPFVCIDRLFKYKLKPKRYYGGHIHE